MFFYEESPGTGISIIQMTGKALTANSKGLRLCNFDQIRGVIDEEFEGVWNSSIRRAFSILMQASAAPKSENVPPIRIRQN